MSTDHYKTLDVPRTASPAEIKAAFRRLAAEHHPDRGGDTARSAEINVAYACLSDSERRARYDASGEDGEDGDAGPTPEQAHQQRVHSEFMAVMEKALGSPDCERFGLLATMRKTFTDAQTNLATKLVKSAAARARLEGIAKKVRRKGAGDDLVQALVGGKLDELRRGEASAAEAERAFNDCLALIDGYEEDAPAAAEGNTMLSTRPRFIVPEQVLMADIARAFGLGKEFGL